ncbi:MAG: hypothetical protein AAFQ74_09955 [Cyanobacteria bacterium J06623_4]
MQQLPALLTSLRQAWMVRPLSETEDAAEMKEIWVLLTWRKHIECSHRLNA